MPAGLPAGVPKAAKGGAKGGAKTLTNRQAEVLLYISKNPGIAYREIAKAMQINESAVLKHIQNLKKAGVLERKGPPRGGRWEVRQ